MGNNRLPRQEAVFAGAAGDRLTIRVGPWTFAFLLDRQGRFPKVHDDIPSPARITSRVTFTESDRRFLTEGLSRLPGGAFFNTPVTVDLNGRAAVRACGEDRSAITEMALSGSTCSGEPLRFNTDRRFLGRALELGFREIELVGPEVAAVCRDAHRRYVWALLAPGHTLPPREETHEPHHTPPTPPRGPLRGRLGLRLALTAVAVACLPARLPRLIPRSPRASAHGEPLR